jgi:mono/diheme cytochrome c family protein
MKRSASVLPFLMLFLLAGPAAAVAQDASLGDQEKLGERLVNQSCVVCHLKQQITSGTYAPVLSGATLGGKADIMREVIGNGTPHMPGFKIQFAPAQIDAIVAYIKSIPAPAAAPRPGKTGGAGEPD